MTTIFKLVLLSLLVIMNRAHAGESNLVTLTTELGDIKIALFIDKAPISSKDFIKYVKQGLYKDQGFYRIVRPDNDQGSPIISVVQGGLLNNKQGLAPVPHENTQQTGLSHTRGIISLARGEVGTGSAAYFFIVVKDSPGLDHGQGRNTDQQGFAAFGKVIQGMNIIDTIYQTPTDKLTGDGYTKGQVLKQPILITNARLN